MSASSENVAKRRKSYDFQYKLDAVEFAEMNSNEKAAKQFQVGYRMSQCKVE
jgi:hypothetical protein